MSQRYFRFSHTRWRGGRDASGAEGPRQACTLEEGTGLRYKRSMRSDGTKPDSAYAPLRLNAVLYVLVFVWNGPDLNLTLTRYRIIVDFRGRLRL
ncbi:hypothetical protein EVAR_62432_1 [Eumeta japonica]|uniref:Uncharacterized protein n=1 Tax=Eumeta variegata TaxID=151549 RepID=A0A4C1Z6B4_EUMVA|nr:hypothetical protein EVAR_62432_1 [Eumeta japonica]